LILKITHGTDAMARNAVLAPFPIAKTLRHGTPPQERHLGVQKQVVKFRDNKSSGN